MSVMRWRRAVIGAAFCAFLVAGCALGPLPVERAGALPAPAAAQVATAELPAASPGVPPAASLTPAMLNTITAPPLQLTASSTAVSAAPVEMSLPDGVILPAINLYRFNAKLPAGNAVRAGADLNGDGVPEAVVLMTEPQCITTGCPLLVFLATQQGYRVVSRTDGVRLPVKVAGESSEGWRDLIVAGADGQSRRLRFATKGYPTLAAAERDDPAALPPGAVYETLLATTDPTLAPVGSWLPDVKQPRGVPVSGFMVPRGGDKEEAAPGQ
jgi:hypothetical protein